MCVGDLRLLVFLWSQDQYMYYDIIMKPKEEKPKVSHLKTGKESCHLFDTQDSNEYMYLQSTHSIVQR